MYKILDTFSILKPLKSGNCTVFDGNPSESLITISKLKELFISNKKSAFQEIKEKIQIVTDSDDSTFNDFVSAVDHDYEMPEIINCTLFYCTARVCKYIKNRVKCEECLKAFLCETSISNDYFSFSNEDLPHNFSKFVNNEKELIHPKVTLYKILGEVEALFKIYCNKKNAFELVLMHFVEKQNIITFPCTLHIDGAKDIFMHMVQYYLQIRTRQYIRDDTAEVKKVF